MTERLRTTAKRSASIRSLRRHTSIRSSRWHTTNVGWTTFQGKIMTERSRTTAKQSASIRRTRWYTEIAHWLTARSDVKTWLKRTKGQPKLWAGNDIEPARYFPEVTKVMAHSKNALSRDMPLCVGAGDHPAA